MNNNTKNKILAPVAKKIKHEFSEHGNTRQDDYFWLRDDSRSSEAVIEHLNNENNYVDANLKEDQNVIDGIYGEIIDRLPKKKQSVPAKIDSYWYYSRYTDQSEYPIYARKFNTLEANEEVILDINLLAQDHPYFKSNYQAVSPNHKLLGYSEDVTGRRQYTLRFKNLETNNLFEDTIENTTGAIVWAKDNKTFFYTKKHPKTLLPFQVYKHVLGSKEKDKLVYEEKDSKFYVSISASTSKNYIFIYLGSTTTTEVLVLNAENPDSSFVSFLPRIKNHEYSIEEHNDNFYILTNWEAKNFRVMHSNLASSKDRAQWQDVVSHSDDKLIYDIHVFSNHLAIEQRQEGIKSIQVLDFNSQKLITIPSDEDSYTMELDFNPDQKSNKLKYSYTSLTSPKSIYEYDVETQKRELLKQDDVHGSYQERNYQTQRQMIKARDGEEVPVSLVYKKGLGKLSSRPVLIYAYGSYGSSVDPRFSYSRASLLDRGFIFAIAHIRGSQAKGRKWYEEGRMLKKKNTFYDFIDVTKGLIEKGIGDSSNVFAMGGSAGGLLMGAVANMRGDLYKGMVAAVPFVDVITTMLDEDIPLTTGEFEEWGNPKEKKYYDYMLSYSPYDQVTRKAYPHMYVSSGLHDSQVQYWEPAKWVAKLREMKTDDNLLFFRTNMEAGHGGASGRYQIYKEVAEEYGFILKLVNSD